MDTRWDHGFIINEEEYLQQRIKLQMELEQLNPVGDDELEQASDLLNNFEFHWNRLEGDDDGRHELVKLIVERVYVQDKKVVAMTLRSNYYLVLGHKTNGPTCFEVDPLLYRNRSDGFRSLTCITFLPKHIAHKVLYSSQVTQETLDWIHQSVSIRL